MIVGTKTEKDETPISLKKENLTELSDVSNEIIYIHRICRKKGDSQDILLVLNNKIAKKKVYNNRKKLTHLRIKPYLTKRR